MEQHHLASKGDHEVITTQHEQALPPAREIEAESSQDQLPTTFAEAKLHSPYQLLVELHDQALSVNTNVENPPQQHLAELALSAAVVHWWSRWQPITMHRAFEAGAHIAEVAGASGLTGGEVYERWSAWAEVQSRLLIGGRPCVDPVAAAAIRARLNQQMQPLV